MAETRTVLMLQGPRSPFFARVADALAAGGARAERVIFCPGDALFWRGRPAVPFRDTPAAWPGFVRRLMQARGVTDVIGLGDGRFWHREAFASARALGLRVHVLEQGYLRPGWLTLEPDRFGGWRWDEAAEAPPLPADPAFRASFAAFAAMDVAHHAANLALGPLLFPHYRTHELWSPLAEWRGWLGKAAATPWRRARHRAALARLAAHRGPVFLMALQLETDFQLRDHGPPGGLPAVLADVQASFARAAPPDALLLVKPHPLDPGLRDWRAQLGPRSLWLEGGAAETLFGRLSGVVTVNSTLGLSALRAGVPVKALGRAVYAPLTDPRPLDAFWTAAAPPDAGRVMRFCAALAAAIQLPGGFDGEGMGPGARAVAARLLGTG